MHEKPTVFQTALTTITGIKVFVSPRKKYRFDAEELDQVVHNSRLHR